MKAAIFDLDGTILDSSLLWDNLSGIYLRGKGIPYPSDINVKVKYMSLREACCYLKKEYRIDDSVERMMDECRFLISEYYLNRLALKMHVREYIEKQKSRGVRMCVATASDKSLASAALVRLGIDKYFDFIITDEDVGCGKNNPAIFYEAAKRLRAKINECVVFEDSLHAVRSAKKGGFTVWAVRDASSSGEEEKIKRTCDRFISGFDELLKEMC